MSAQCALTQCQGQADMFIDTLRVIHILARVIRYILALLCAIGLAASPALANVGLSPTSSMPGCTMGGEMPDMPPDHSTMDCCTAACHAPSSAAFVPKQDACLATGAIGKVKLVGAPIKELVSAVGSGLDPPPRL